MKRIKILHIAKMKGVSGSENHLLTLLPTLDREGFDARLCILTEARHLPKLTAYQAAFEQQGIPVCVLIVRKYPNLSVIWRLWRYLRQEQIDIVHTHLIHADLYGTLAAKLASVPAIVSSRHNDDRFRRHPLSRVINRMLAHWQCKLIVISDWVGTFLHEVEGIPADKIARIHYGLDPAPLELQADPHYIRQQFQLPDNVPLIGTIGRLTDQKGQTYLLQAVQQVERQFPDLRVVLIGDGELRATLERQASELGIAKNIIFAGYRTDALKLLSGLDFFVLPSLWEGFGLVLLEAMALKKAVVASQVSAIPEIVLDGETGILTPAQNPVSLASAIIQMLTQIDVARTMGNAGAIRLHEKFTVRTMVERTERIYVDLLQQRLR